MEFEVKENYNKGVSLYVYDNFGNQYAHTDYKDNPNLLLNSIFNLYSPYDYDCNVTAWNYNDIKEGENISKYYDNSPDTDLICKGNDDGFTIYFNEFGAEGEICFAKFLELFSKFKIPVKEITVKVENTNK